MNVGFDAHMVGQRETGNETYALGLLHGFHQIGLKMNVYSLVSLPWSIHRVHHILVSPSIVRIPLIMPLLAARDELDLFHATYVLPPLMTCQSVVTIHDITYVLHPEWFTPRVRLMLDTLVPIALGTAARVITISAATKQDIVDRYQIDPERIAITHLAPRPAFGSREEVERADEPFFLYVGNVEPRKNLTTIIEALSLVRDRGVDVPLVVAGKPGLHHAQIERLVARLRLSDLVRFVGYVTDDELRRFYATCTALLHPALYEGFGLTPLEAMVQGAPVLVSNTSSLPEVVGEAALLHDPYDVESWANSMERIVQDARLQRSLQERGEAHARRFTWERCARQTLAIYESVLAEP